jgi:hypothetical protein
VVSPFAHDDLGPHHLRLRGGAVTGALMVFAVIVVIVAVLLALRMGRYRE